MSKTPEVPYKKAKNGNSQLGLLFRSADIDII